MRNQRRQFLKDAVIATGCLCVGASVLQACQALVYVPYTYADRTITVKKADFAENKYVVVKPEQLPAPIYLCKLEDGKFSAVLMLCTHKQCQLTPSVNTLTCPCHGSEFSQTGEVLESPAQEPLKKFEVTEDGQNIYIREEKEQ